MGEIRFSFLCKWGLHLVPFTFGTNCKPLGLLPLRMSHLRTLPKMGLQTPELPSAADPNRSCADWKRLLEGIFFCSLAPKEERKELGADTECTPISFLWSWVTQDHGQSGLWVGGEGSGQILFPIFRWDCVNIFFYFIIFFYIYKIINLIFKLKYGVCI